MTMNTRDLTGVLPTLLSELVNGSPDPTVGTSMLNRGDPGLLVSLEKISAAAASATTSGGGSIAAHTDHLHYGFSILNRWAAGENKPWKDADWTKSWKRGTVSASEWRTLRDNLRREVGASGRMVAAVSPLHASSAIAVTIAELVRIGECSFRRPIGTLNLPHWEKSIGGVATVVNANLFLAPRSP